MDLNDKKLLPALTAIGKELRPTLTFNNIAPLVRIMNDLTPDGQTKAAAAISLMALSQKFWGDMSEEQQNSITEAAENNLQRLKNLNPRHQHPTLELAFSSLCTTVQKLKKSAGNNPPPTN